jgi:hypothetical protein
MPRLLPTPEAHDVGGAIMKIAFARIRLLLRRLDFLRIVQAKHSLLVESFDSLGQCCIAPMLFVIYRMHDIISEQK